LGEHINVRPAFFRLPVRAVPSRVHCAAFLTMQLSGRILDVASQMIRLNRSCQLHIVFKIYFENKSESKK
ncbi:hypothetical protein ABEO83_01330, partial [Bacillus glycinifermentans]|uniref:hypothetical protein n=1 Tax=Bacillus glycinifermentans TaxID=1664069 RepID=UPI003D20C6B4